MPCKEFAHLGRDRAVPSGVDRGGLIYENAAYGGDNALLSLDARTGTVRWQVPGLFGDPAVAGGRVFAGTGASLRALDAATGTLRWSVAVAGSGSPAVANGLVYLGLQQGIGAWRLSDGVRRWRSGTIPYGSPAVSGGRVYAPGVRSANGQEAAVVDQFRLAIT